MANPYNLFINRHRDVLVGSNDVLKIYFMRAAGISEGRRAYDQFTTALANSHSTYAMTTAASFCQSAETLVQLTHGAQPQELVALAANMSDRPFGVGDACDVVAASAMPYPATAAPVPPVPVAAAVPVDTAMPVAAIAPAPVVPPREEALPPAAVASAVPVAPSASAAAVAPVAAPEAGQSLADAITALRSATEALRAATVVNASASAAIRDRSDAMSAPVYRPSFQPQPIGRGRIVN